MFCGHKRSVGFFAEGVFLQQRGDILVDAGDLRSASAHYDDVGIEEVDYAIQAAREAILEAIESCKGLRLSGCTARENFRPAKGSFRGTLVIFFEAGAGNPGFDAPVSPAVARGTGEFVRAHP